jgi:transposase InsO family protein
MRVIHGEVHETDGSPRMHAELVARGLPCNVKRVARLMRLHHLRARHKRKYRVTTKANPKLPVAPNQLTQQFHASAPNEKWVSDITYVWTREGWLYLAVVMDLYSRRIVGWALARTQATPLVVAALHMAIGRRQPLPGLLHHSDRGSQYASMQYQAVLQAHHFTVSMSGTGNCFDNAAMESFFGTLKAERINRHSYQTRDQARQDIVAYIEGFYNVTRRHSTLGYRSPLEFEQASAMA